MKQSKGKTIFDWIVIILGMSYGISVLSELFYIEGFGVTIPLSLFLILSHTIRFGTKFSIFKELGKSWLLVLYFTIIFFDFLQALLNLGTSNITNASVRLVYLFFYASYLCNVYTSYGFDYLIKPYITYTLYNIGAITIMAILIIAGIDWHQNEVAYQLLLDDMQDGAGAVYYFPYYISLVASYHDYSIFSLIPGITGLSHEPNAITWVITPAFFFIFAYRTKKTWVWLMVLLYLFIILESFSTMTFIVITGVMALHYVWLSRKKSIFIYLIPIVLVVSLLAYFFADTFDLILDIVKAKSDAGDTQGGSIVYSMDMLKYLFSFKELFGYGNLPPGTGDVNVAVSSLYSAGIITGFLDFVLYAIMIVKTIKLVFSNDSSRHFFGLGFIYMLLHGIKINYGLFGYPLFFLFLFSLHTISSNNGKELQEFKFKSLYS